MISAEPEIKSIVKSWMSEKKNLRGHPKVFWVTGELVCQNVYIAASDTNAKELTIRGEIPIGTCVQLAAQAAIACPLPIDLSALPNIVGERSRLTANSKCFAAKAQDTYIIGLQLQQVVLSGKKGSEDISTKEASLKLPNGRQLEDSESEDEDGMPVIVELDDEMWDILLEDSVESLDGAMEGSD